MTTFVVPPLDRTPWPTLGPAVCDFIEAYLPHGPGDLKGEPARIDDETRALIYRTYEVYPRGHAQAGRRRFKRVCWSLRKGTAKTEKAAWLAACELHPDAPVRTDGWRKVGRRWEPVGVGVRDPYIPMVSYTEEQTDELAYGALYVILSESSLADDFDIGLDRIIVLDDRGRAAGRAVSVAGAPNARDGARTTFQHFDEPLALTTPVPTVGGWRTIGELVDGDQVFGRDGQPVKVIGMSPVHTGRRCFRVTFSDGHSVVTDEGHRWKVVDWRNRPQGEVVVTTGQMFEAGTETAYGRRWRLPRGAGIDGTTADLPVDPYLLGLWLGDGATDAGYIHSATDDYSEMSVGVPHARSTSKPGLVRWLPTGLRQRLRRLGVLGAKHIPDVYLFASRRQRLALLAGLMDTDGHTTKGGSCTFVQTKRRLAEDVATLVRSLGCSASLVRSVDERAKNGEMWKVHFSPAFCPFRLPRKAQAAAWGERRCTSWPAVVSIEPVPSVPVRCIAVDNDDHLFVVGRGFHLTHNTHRFTLGSLKNAHKTMLANIPKRKVADAWSLETTTAFTPGEDSIAEQTYAYAESVRAGKTGDSRLFFFHRQASDRHDLGTEAGVRAAVIEASGPAIEWSDTESIVALWQEPTTDLAYFARVWCNRPTQAIEQAFNVDRWDAAARPDIVVPEGALITLGFDGSKFWDATALVATWVPKGHQFTLGVWERPEGPSGDGWEVPEDEVEQLVDFAFDSYRVWRLYGDPPYWEEALDRWAGRHGTTSASSVPSAAQRGVVKWWTHRQRPMAYAIAGWHHAILAGDLTHDGHPILRAHVGNARKRVLSLVDDKGEKLWTIGKERKDSPRHIDAAMAACLSWEARGDAIVAGLIEDSAPATGRPPADPDPRALFGRGGDRSLYERTPLRL